MTVGLRLEQLLFNEGCVLDVSICYEFFKPVQMKNENTLRHKNLIYVFFFKK